MEKNQSGGKREMTKTDDEILEEVLDYINSLVVDSETGEIFNNTREDLKKEIVSIFRRKNKNARNKSDS